MNRGGTTQTPQTPPSLDWTAVLDGAHSDAPPPPPELHVNPSSYDPAAIASDGLDLLTDKQLRESIQSKNRTLENAGKCLPDGGARLRANIKRCEEELCRRKVKGHQEACYAEKMVVVWEKLAQQTTCQELFRQSLLKETNSIA